MSRRTPTGTFWPSPQQEHLLEAALGDPAVAVTGWRDLQPSFDLDRLEPGSFALMPLIYRNLVRGGDAGKLLPRLKGIYRRTWVNNSLLLERTKDASEALSQAGLRALFVEGVVLATRFYPELGLRPTAFIDILVDAEAAAASTAALAKAGWSERPEHAAEGARQLFDRDGNMCVLRTSFAIDFVGRGERERSLAPVWDAATELDVGDRKLLVPARTDVLLAVCVSNARAWRPKNMQWIADAKMVLGLDLDWERLLTIGIERGQARRLRDVFRYLSRLPGPQAPLDVCDRLERTRVAPRERLAYASSAGSIRGMGALPYLVAEHLAATAHESPARAFATFPRHLRDRWNLAHGWQLPAAAGRRAIRLLARGGKRAA